MNDRIDPWGRPITRERIEALKAGMWKEIGRRQRRRARIRRFSAVAGGVSAAVLAILILGRGDDEGTKRPESRGGTTFSEDALLLARPDSTGTQLADSTAARHAQSGVKENVAADSTGAEAETEER